MYLGIDLLIKPNKREFALLEANAFGDYLPRLTHNGHSTYEAELVAIANRKSKSCFELRTMLGVLHDIVMITLMLLGTMWQQKRSSMGPLRFYLRSFRRGGKRGIPQVISLTLRMQLTLPVFGQRR